jgi:enoyl-CoA hydratase/carnithine racemase
MNKTMTDDVLVREQRGAVLIARLNRPDARNALNGELMSAIGRALLDAEQEAETRAVVLTGTGDRAFCAGMDLREFAGGGAPALDADGGAAFGRFMSGQIAIPVIGAANATAVAGGMELLLACDLVVASSQAKFGLPEVQRGLIPAGGGVLLGSRLPLALALELNLTGDAVSAQRAYEMGLINRVVDPGAVLDTAVQLATRIASNGPLAIRHTKEIVRQSAIDAEGARAKLNAAIPVIFGSDDAREGATAFVERREPRWQGR